MAAPPTPPWFCAPLGLAQGVCNSSAGTPYWAIPAKPAEAAAALPLENWVVAIYGVAE